MNAIHYFDEVFHSCVIGSKKATLSPDEVKLNSFLRACHKLLPIYINNGLVYHYRDEALSKGYSKDYLLYLYNDRLSKKETTSRRYYNKLMEEAPDDKCQLCFIADAQSLDHFLHKDDYPSLSISSNNLLPVCIPCNGVKGVYCPQDYKSQLLHPKDERVFSKFWLSADFNEDEKRIKISADFEAFKEDPLTVYRIESHLKKFGLITAYEALAARQIGEFVRLSKTLKTSLKSVIAAELSKLNERAQVVPIAKYSIDQWSWITCYALLKSDFFMKNAATLFDKSSLIKKPGNVFR